MTDEAVICTWMEPEAAKAVVIDKAATWKWHRLDWSNNTIHTRPLTLDALWEVEERMQVEARNPDDDMPCIRRNLYLHLLSELAREYWHATAAQKITALAAVLRPIVEVACPSE